MEVGLQCKGLHFFVSTRAFTFFASFVGRSLAIREGLDAAGGHTGQIRNGRKEAIAQYGLEMPRTNEWQKQQA